MTLAASERIGTWGTAGGRCANGDRCRGEEIVVLSISVPQCGGTSAKAFSVRRSVLAQEAHLQSALCAFSTLQEPAQTICCGGECVEAVWGNSLFDNT